MITFSSESQRVLEETKRNYRRRQAWYRKYFKSTGKLPVEVLINIMISAYKI